MFEKATRQKVRFNYKGQCSVEDLWDLKVTELDGIYRKLRGEQKKVEEDTLLATTTAADATLALQIDIVKHIVQVKLAEREARLAAAENKAKKDKLTAILAAKQDAALENLSEEELRQQIAALA